MSAVNVVLYPDRVLLFTDTKATTAEGLQYNAVKFAGFPWARMAIAVRGYMGALRVFERALSQNARNLEEAVQFLAEQFATIRAGEYLDATEARAMREDVDVYLVGWGVNGPAASWISNYRTGGKMQRIEFCHISPMVSIEAQRAFAEEIKTGIIPLMEAQAREQPGVGGWLMVTEVGEQTITSYPLGGLCGLSSMTARMQQPEEAEAMEAVKVANADRAARLAALRG